MLFSGVGLSLLAVGFDYAVLFGIGCTGCLECVVCGLVVMFCGLCLRCVALGLVSTLVLLALWLLYVRFE